MKFEGGFGARKALRVADPALESVTALATRWGFWHMGQFTKDYKRLFAELPSETLKKRHARLLQRLDSSPL